VNINTLSEVLQEAEIKASVDELQPHFERAYEDYRPKAELRGFRKGKVPLGMIKKIYGEAIEYQSLDDVAGELYRQAMAERNIHPIGKPSVTDMDFKRGEHFRFKIQYEVKPVIELKKYKGIAVEKPVHRVTDAEIESEVAHLRKINSSTTDVGSVTDSFHIVTGDIQELDETGTPLIGKKTPNTRFDLSDDSLVKEIKDALSHAEVGGAYRATFESRHGDHAHPMHVAISVSKVEKVNLPVFDDALVKKVTSDKVATAEEFLQKLRADLTQYWEEQAERSVADGIAATLVKDHDFAIPESIVNSLLDAFVDDVRSRSGGKKLPQQFDEEKFRNDSREYATWQAKWMLLKEQIAEAENITVTPEDIDGLAETESVRTGIEKSRLLEYYKNSGAATERILSDKIMLFLRNNAKVKEKVVEEPSQK